MQSRWHLHEVHDFGGKKSISKGRWCITLSHLLRQHLCLGCSWSALICWLWPHQVSKKASSHPSCISLISESCRVVPQVTLIDTFRKALWRSSFQRQILQDLLTSIRVSFTLFLLLSTVIILIDRRNTGSLALQTQQPGEKNPREKYEGAFLGKFNSYSHQVSGDVYVIDEYTYLIKNFFYDGLAQDAFFWAGATVRPSNIGFIVPDEKGKTNKLRRYINQDIRIRIPDDKKINSLKWLAVWDIRDNHNFADIYIPEGFEAPAPKKISEFTGIAHGVKSGQVTVIDSKTFKISDFVYDGLSESTFFFVGTGPQPNPSGKKIPNELG